MKENYASAIKHVLAEEGGKIEHPADPGGRTNQGITQRVYNGWRTNKGLSVRDVYVITAKERDSIYRVNYWDIIQGDLLPSGVDFVVFDGAVNSGASQSVKWLQRCLGVRVDGVMGEATLSAAREHPNPRQLVNAICDRRIAFLQALATFKTFGKGWMNRVARVRTFGMELASGQKLPAPTQSVKDLAPSPKARLEDAKRAPQTATADVSAGAGIPAGATAAETISKTQEALAPAAGTSKWLDLLYTFLVLAGVAITVGGIVYALYARRKRAELVDALDLRPPQVVGEI